MPSLNSLISLIEDAGITKRTDGLKQLKAAFEPSNTYNIVTSNARSNDQSEGEVCAAIHEALTSCINRERALLHKPSKTKTAISTRLENAASTLRFIVEQTFHFLEAPQFTKLLGNLTRISVDNDALLPETSLSCAKAMRSLLGNSACVDRMSFEVWLNVVQFALNIVIGDPVSRDILDNDDTMSDTMDPFYTSEASGGEEPPSKRRKTSAEPSGSILASGRSASSKPPQTIDSAIRYDMRVRVELMGFLSDLFRACHWPLLSQNHPGLPGAILSRFSRFLATHGVDSSLHPDCISCLHAILTPLSLNRRCDVEKFACSAWKSLTNLWKSKDKRLKEGLTSIFFILFPFGEASRSDSLHKQWLNGVSELWLILEKEYYHHNQPLTLESFRLEIPSSSLGSNNLSSFTADTFRLASGASTTEALSWAILELVADCTQQLYLCSESFDPSFSLTQRKGEKRSKLNDPLSAILSSISSGPSSVYHLQMMLFVVDRHWACFHDDLQRRIITEMLRLVAVDNSETQAWGFVILAAIAYASSNPAKSFPISSDSAIWDSIWTHSVRRVNVPALSRAACHSAHVILNCSRKGDNVPHRLSASENRILSEVEILGANLDVQGPSSPCDSVCMFLSECIRIAGQDVRLFRMHFNDQALQWLTHTWTVNKLDIGQAKTPPFLIKDIITLLGAICEFEKTPSLVQLPLYPECQIANTLRECRRFSVIRNFLLSAHLPSDRQGWSPDAPEMRVSKRLDDSDLLSPTETTSRALDFTQKIAERLSDEWTARAAQEFRPSVDQAFEALNLITLTLTFNGLVALNGFRLNARIFQCTSHVLPSALACCNSRFWTPYEKLHLLRAISPLVISGAEGPDPAWEALVSAGRSTGIRRRVLKSLMKPATPEADANLLDLHRRIWTSTEMQDCSSEYLIDNFMQILSDIPRMMSSSVDDEFGPVKTLDTATGLGAAAYAELSSICFNFLTVVPYYQSASGKSTVGMDLRNKLSSQNLTFPIFRLFERPFSDAIRRGVLKLDLSSIVEVLDQFLPYLQDVRYTSGGSVYVTFFHFAEATMDLWLPSISEKDNPFCSDLLDILRFASRQFRNGHIHNWEAKDSLLRFANANFIKHPQGANLFGSADIFMDLHGKKPPKATPGLICLSMNLMLDDDIRVRFRAATTNARLFEIYRENPFYDRNVMEFYSEWVGFVPSDVLGEAQFELLLTRILTLANIVVANSVVRRGPFWNILETVLVSRQEGQDIDPKHFEAALQNVARRMGLARQSILFGAYASQMAVTFRAHGYSIFDFPPRILGFADNIELAHYSFALLTPPNVTVEGEDSQITFGRNAFETHCKYVQKTPSEGLMECFGDVVGLQVMAAMTDILDGQPVDLDAILRQTMSCMGDDEYQNALAANFPSILVAILSGLGDLDFGANGPIIEALRSPHIPVLAPIVFQELVHHRRLDDVEIHEPNRPAYPTLVIIQSLLWIRQRFSSQDLKAASYHIFRIIFYRTQQALDVNEQIRLLNALCIWIALHADEVADANLLIALMHGAVSLSAQEDLLNSARSILDWALTRYGENEKSVHRNFSDILVRLCCVIHEHASHPGDGIVEWLDKRVLALSKFETLRNQVVYALATWPYEPSSALKSLVPSSFPISRVLNDPSITSNKFRLVRRLDEDAQTGKYDPKDFLHTDFWQLKANIPPRSDLHDEDIISFARLLLFNHGRIGTFTDVSSKPLANTTTTAQKLGSKIRPAREIIVASLLRLLNGSDDEKCHLAFLTLRRLLSSSNILQLDFSAFPVEDRHQIRFIGTYPAKELRQPPSDFITQLLDDNYLGQTSDFPVWVGTMTSSISRVLGSKDSFFHQLSEVLAFDQDIARELFPILVQSLLGYEKNLASEESRSRIGLSRYFSRVLQDTSACVHCVQAIIDVILHLRHSQPSTPALTPDQWLDVDFLLLARRSVACGAYTTSLLFLELFHEYSSSRPNSAHLDEILYDIYNHIDEPDGFYGIESSDLQTLLVKRFHHEQQWDKALRFHGAEVEAGNRTALPGLLQTLTAMGFDNLATNTVASAASGASHPASINYRLGWRTDQWDLPLPGDFSSYSPDASLYTALRAVNRERDSKAVVSTIRNSLFRDLQHLRGLGDENLSEMREVVRNIMSLYQVIDWYKSSDDNMSLLERLPQISSNFDFSDLELILSTRIAVIRSVRRREQRQHIGPIPSPAFEALANAEINCLVRLSEAARSTGRGQVALNAITIAQGLSPSEQPSDVIKEYAHVLWLEREEKPAIQVLRRLSDSFVDGASLNSAELIQEAVVLTQLGHWTAKARLQKPVDIQKCFFDPAIQRVAALDASAEVEELGEIYYRYATFADAQYHAAHENVATALHRRRAADHKKGQILQLEKQLQELENRSLREEERRQRKKALHNKLRIAQKQERDDRSVFITAENMLTSFLRTALDLYSRALRVCDKYNDSASLSLCSLWLANFEEDELQDLIEQCMRRVQSHKMVFLSHQISARLKAADEGSVTEKVPIHQKHLRAFLLRMVKEHPFHSVFPIYLMRGKQQNTEGRRSSRKFSAVERKRMAAASEILQKLVQDATVTTRILDLLRVADACLDWAEYRIKEAPWLKKVSPEGKIKVPSDVAILKLTNIQVPVITAHTKIDPSLRYDDVDYIARYETEFSTAGGVNLPKINACIGHSGIRYKQLFKGEGADDLRQDAVMEQVFDLCNTLLRRDAKTRQRELGIRGYKVVPLATTAGMLEYVDNTTVLNAWLGSAHARYHPTDYHYADIAGALTAIQRFYPKDTMAEFYKKYGELYQPSPKSLEERLLYCFKKFKERFHPVMRHWFYESAKVPMVWFKMRLNYTRSVATTSVVGHVLGLGDRHTKNILLDNDTGEVVHIDLGIAFEQGKYLPIPETVPFRLTPDIVDGMGMSQTQGVFQRCSEETLRVLRERSSIILTVLEVFKHDPLHNWTVSESKRLRVQESREDEHIVGFDPTHGEGESNVEMADRVMTTVRRKLDQSLSLESTVNDLIAEATSVDNLSKLYGGWSPHL